MLLGGEVEGVERDVLFGRDGRNSLGKTLVLEEGEITTTAVLDDDSVVDVVQEGRALWVTAENVTKVSTTAKKVSWKIKNSLLLVLPRPGQGPQNIPSRLSEGVVGLSDARQLREPALRGPVEGDQADDVSCVRVKDLVACGLPLDDDGRTVSRVELGEVAEVCNGGGGALTEALGADVGRDTGKGDDLGLGVDV